MLVRRRRFAVSNHGARQQSHVTILCYIIHSINQSMDQPMIRVHYSESLLFPLTLRLTLTLTVTLTQTLALWCISAQWTYSTVDLRNSGPVHNQSIDRSKDKLINNQLINPSVNPLINHTISGSIDQIKLVQYLFINFVFQNTKHAHIMLHIIKIFKRFDNIHNNTTRSSIYLSIKQTNK